MNGDAAPDWTGVELAGDPTMFIGWRRSNKRLEARRVSLHEDTFEALHEIGAAAISQLRTMRGLPYSPYVHPELGEEYIYLPLAADVPDSDGRGSDLAGLCRNLDAVQEITAEELRTHDFQFYGIAYASGENLVAFVRKSNPRRTLQGAHKFFKFSGSLKRVARPDIVLEDTVDLVVTQRALAVLRSFSFEMLAPDVNFSEENVQRYVDDLVGALQGKVVLSAGSIEALREVSGRKTSLVKRLKNLHSRASQLQITPASVQEILRRHDLAEVVQFDADGNVVLNVESVEVFVDLLEGRYFEQDFTGDAVRADRFRRRTVRSSPREEA
ncbi:hypothetical protein CTKZ_08440 [Cellulomonas algicola]|uniref:DUF4868 domain-containing protein n=1 Tax=Cellulomonas algicola TaxID=2071633 RepID=A0A401UXC3_9CELL|nr:hypothetical protein [Cellulomonas algicola]GCD19282.1 hypothetical protein CTKZ_08440 [Cellulomonas algicola]